ncbi:peptidase S9, prolyl oligopeptidase [Blyttiomyces helicus]|uniref:Prolyl endopeptidase n=1 Tax=Blyttiomyces helicus TaxID=388810 RepID=A0A4P9W8A2_9FUNG|nr:peptidase S9, prolyl oligopeptidase [Blyttiomyces helicus]|eukprot:RKO88564.1 peptidase S9, prolyl oligopeptidase [Blyttiomyces helicus]
MFIISRKDTPLDGANPTILYGYGGFNISILPSFSVTWLHMKGVVAVANTRGGGEYGEKWYNEGRLGKKQNVFDDFQWAAKWLIANNYTTPKKLAISGASNGGLLVCACLNQAPELFGLGMAGVGVLDMYRFHKFTAGSAWTSDYGNPDKAEDFAVLEQYSPVHNVQTDKPYPAVLASTGDHDDRVPPLHSYKYIATLQHVAPQNPQPLMIRVETKAGHGAGKSTQQKIEEATETYAFLGKVLEVEWVDDVAACKL